MPMLRVRSSGAWRAISVQRLETDKFKSRGRALDKVRERTQEDPLKVFKKAVENLQPRVEVKSKRVGGATYQVPVEVRTERAQALAIRWLISAARARSEKTMSARLSGELMDASQNRGNAVKKREDTHRMADANRAFSHYRW